MRQRAGRREREAGKRRGRVWSVQTNRSHTIADFRFFMHYPEPESTPLKLGRKHYARTMLASLTGTVADSRKEAK